MSVLLLLFFLLFNEIGNELLLTFSEQFLLFGLLSLFGRILGFVVFHKILSIKYEKLN
jgi:hypothetical protein